MRRLTALLTGLVSATSASVRRAQLALRFKHLEALMDASEDELAVRARYRR